MPIVEERMIVASHVIPFRLLLAKIKYAKTVVS